MKELPEDNCKEEEQLRKRLHSFSSLWNERNDPLFTAEAANKAFKVVTEEIKGDTDD